MRKRSSNSAVRASLPMASQNFSVEESASIIGRGRDFVYGLIASGELKTVKLGSRRLIPGARLQQYLDTLSESAA